MKILKMVLQSGWNGILKGVKLPFFELAKINSVSQRKNSKWAK